MFPIPHVNLPYNLVLIPMFRVSNIPLELIPFTFYTFIEVRTIKRMDIYGLITNNTNCGPTLQKTTCEVTRMKILISLSYLIFLMQMPLIVILPFQLSLNNLYAEGLASLIISTASSVQNVASVSSSFFLMVSKVENCDMLGGLDYLKSCLFWITDYWLFRLYLFIFLVLISIYITKISNSLYHRLPFFFF